MEVSPVFVFGPGPPCHLTVYTSIADAADSLESLDITGQVEVYTATAQIVAVTATTDLFGHLEVTDRTDPARLRVLLRRVPGPTHLIDDPAAYAQEWLARDDASARRPPLIGGIIDRLRLGVEQLMAKRDREARASLSREPCPCCGHRTLPERGTYELCPVCFWEDDPHQTDDPTSRGGANGVSLIDAQQAYIRHGAMDPVFVSQVRQPCRGEERDPDWRPLGTG